MGFIPWWKEDLYGISSSPLDLPISWMIMGDFNVVKCLEYKLGGLVPTRYLTRDFVDCCTQLSLIDAPSSCNLFTWTNGRVKAKLDRILISITWQSSALACFVDLLKFDCISDQCPMVVKLFDNSCEGNRLFKIFNMWLTHPRFHYILEEGWGSTVIGTKQFLVAAKLKALKTLLKEFNKLEFGYISERAKRENEEFQAFIHNFNVEFASEKDRERIENLRERACFLAKAESLFFCQKLKTKHLIQPDRSSKYFHDLIRKQHRDVAINFILDQYGEPTTFIAQVGSLLIIFSICLGKQGAGETVNMSSSFKGEEST